MDKKLKYSEQRKLEKKNGQDYSKFYSVNRVPEKAVENAEKAFAKAKSVEDEAVKRFLLKKQKAAKVDSAKKEKEKAKLLQFRQASVQFQKPAAKRKFTSTQTEITQYIKNGFKDPNESKKRAIEKLNGSKELMSKGPKSTPTPTGLVNYRTNPKKVPKTVVKPSLDYASLLHVAAEKHKTAFELDPLYHCMKKTQEPKPQNTQKVKDSKIVQTRPMNQWEKDHLLHSENYARTPKKIKHSLVPTTKRKLEQSVVPLPSKRKVEQSKSKPNKVNPSNPPKVKNNRIPSPGKMIKVCPQPPKLAYVLHSDEEEDDMDDFIDDEEEIVDVSKHIRDIFGYDRRKYVHEKEDTKGMDASYKDIEKEEKRSKVIGQKEDAEEWRKEQEQKRKKQLLKNKKLLS